jgi:hypothetical protein
MIKRTLGAPFGGTIVGGHHGLDPGVLLDHPPNFGSGADLLPSIVVVALGDPSFLTTWALAGPTTNAEINRVERLRRFHMTRIPSAALLSRLLRVGEMYAAAAGEYANPA